MSIRIVNRVLHHGPDEPHLRLLLVAIAIHANDTGQAWPTIDRLADMTCVHPRNTKRSVQRLEKDGWISITRQHNRANRYQLDLDRIKGGGAHATPPTPGVTPTPPRGDAHATPGGDAHATQVVRNVKEPPRSGVSPPPVNGRRHPLTPEQTHHHADAARAVLRQQASG